MPSMKKPEELKAQLQQSVEALAIQVVMGEDDDWDASTDASGDNAEVSEALRQISEQAAAAACPEVAEIASELLSSLSDGETGSAGAGGPDADTLSEGIQRLQNALALDAGPRPESASPPEPIPAQPVAKNATPSAIAQDTELLGDFIVESREHLANVEDQLLVVEREQGNKEALNSVFRGFHTIKGLAGFMDLGQIRKVAHHVETALDLAREGELAITPRMIDVVLEGADYLKVAVDGVEALLEGKQQPPLPDSKALLGRVSRLVKGEPEDEPAPASEPPSEEAVPAAPTETKDAEPPAPAEAKGAEPARPPAEQQRAADKSAAPAGAGAAATGAASTRVVKVDTDKLDHLVDMVGEMVVAQSLLRHDPDMATLRSPRLEGNITQLARITSDVQKTAMSMRMVQVGGLFKRMARLVRDLSRKAGKKVELVTSGEDTELDRNIVEELADPLMHMIRNSIDHGLEPPAEREAAGKPPTGRVSLAAYHQSGLIVVELSDDGRGLNRAKILKKGREKGLIGDRSEISDSEVYNLIFEPGFSTAAKVTDVSGRGVGMDVVKRNLTKLRGRVDIQSVEGKGTTFCLKLPLTLAIIEGLIVGVGGERYIVPIYTVRELLRPTREALSTVQAREEMVMVRGSLLPMVRLHRCFQVEPRSQDPTECLLIVAETLGKRFCMMVDELIGKQEVVIKSLGEALKQVTGISGGAILGDGRVGLILDMDGIFGAGGDA